MTDRVRIAAEGDAVLEWLTTRRFAGFDPFDGLESPIFSRSGFAASRAARLVWLHLVKRCPVNLRPLLRIRPERNAKAVGLVLSALAQRRAARGALERLVGDGLVEWLAEARLGGSAGWGYPFAWQNRAFYAPRGTPNAICTVFVIMGLLDYAEAGGGARASELAASGLKFFLSELRRTESTAGTCFSYTSLDRTCVHNVNLLVAATVARLGRALGQPAALETAARAAAYSIAAQRGDGAWVYGDAPNQAWVDSFHTGFNLGALRVLAASLPPDAAAACAHARRTGYDFFRRFLVEEDGMPRFYDRQRWPLDAHVAAQGIITLVQHGDLDATALPLALRMADRARRALGRRRGEYVYQRGRVLSKPIVYARWCQAWMLLALAELEAAVAGVGRVPATGVTASRERA